MPTSFYWSIRLIRKNGLPSRGTYGSPYDPLPQAPPIIYEEVIIKAPPKKVIKG